MDEKAVKAGISAQKKYFRRLLIAVALIVLGVFIYDSFIVGNIAHEVKFGETELRLSVSGEGGAYQIVIPYAEIQSVEYLEDADFQLGEMLEGVQSRRLWCGRWKNEALGEYDLYADPKVKSWAVIKTDSGTTLFNTEDNAMTEKLAAAIREQLMQR